MTPELKLKPDFPKTVARFAAWWQHEILDRPPVSLGVKSTRPYQGPPEKKHATLRDRWLDVEYSVDRSIAWLECQDYAGDSFPILFPNVGPEITATLYGCELEFGEVTSWSHPIVHEAAEWEGILQRQPNFNNVYWQTIERMTDYAIARCQNRFVVGLTDLHGNYDILAGLRDPEVLCMDLVDCPEMLQKVGRHVARGYVAAFERAWRKVAAAGFGCTSWTNTYHPGPMYIPSCDFWCMVSPTMARELIWPDIEVEMQPLERSIFHLDGPNALPHLDLLLNSRQLNAVQWVFGDGHGPASKWLDVYRRCLAAKKGIQVLAGTHAEGLALLRELGPRGVWLCIGQGFDSVGEANAYLAEVEKISAQHPRR